MKLGPLACLIVALLGNTSVAQTAGPYEFQGNVLGVTTFQEASAKLKKRDAFLWQSDARCMTPQNGTRSCLSMSSLATVYNFVDDRLASISFAFNHDLYLTSYVDGVTEKFGQPVKTTASYQNGYGATYVGNVWTWKNDLGQIVLEEYGDSRQAGKLRYSDTKLDAEYNKRTKYKPEL